MVTGACLQNYASAAQEFARLSSEGADACPHCPKPVRLRGLAHWRRSSWPRHSAKERLTPPGIKCAPPRPLSVANRPPCRPLPPEPPNPRRNPQQGSFDGGKGRSKGGHSAASTAKRGALWRPPSAGCNSERTCRTRMRPTPQRKHCPLAESGKVHALCLRPPERSISGNIRPPHAFAPRSGGRRCAFGSLSVSRADVAAKRRKGEEPP